MNCTYQNYLAHHGIKGQKWGVRRFQNEDGSLTPEGMRREARLHSKDAKAYDKEARRASRQIKEKYSEKEQERWLNDNFGEDWKDSKYMNDAWKIKNPHKFADKELRKEYTKEAQRYKRSAEESRHEAQIFMDRYKKTRYRPTTGEKVTGAALAATCVAAGVTTGTPLAMIPFNVGVLAWGHHIDKKRRAHNEKLVRG